jgi:indole-3-glycerol phosphate synthase
MSTQTSTHLDRILAQTRRTVAERKAAANLRELERRAAEHTPRGFAFALHYVAKTGPAIIAELKKASPSRGLIRPEFDPASLAKTLEAAGAAVLSVLTDEPFFQGSLQNLEIASAAVHLPCLRKDFMVDEFQILEARAHHADAILLIAAALTDAELKTLRACAKQYGLDVLCEVHNREELERVLDLGCEAYGVNSRNLKNFSVSLSVAEELAPLLPASAVRVAESGIHTSSDIELLQRAGYQAFLVGESLMRQPDPGAALRALLIPATARV